MKSLGGVFGFITFAVLACGPSTDYNQELLQAPSVKPNASSDSNQILKTKSTVSSVDGVADGGGSGGGDNSTSNGLQFAAPDVALNQGESKEVQLNISGGSPNSTLTLTATPPAGVRVEYVSMAGAALTAGIPLDASGAATVKVRVSSIIDRTPTKVTAPGALAKRALSFAGQSGSASLSGKVNIEVSNSAVFVMSGATNVRDLPATFEFPAGTVPVFMNPPTTAVVAQMHFGGGQFRHQSTAQNMPANRGYCPLNTAVTVQVQPNAPLPAECMPCPAMATADSMGTFYNHQTENAGQARTIICKARVP